MESDAAELRGPGEECELELAAFHDTARSEALGSGGGVDVESIMVIVGVGYMWCRRVGEG